MSFMINWKITSFGIRCGLLGEAFDAAGVVYGSIFIQDATMAMVSVCTETHLRKHNFKACMYYFLESYQVYGSKKHELNMKW